MDRTVHAVMVKQRVDVSGRQGRMEDLTAEHTEKGLHTMEAWLLVCTDPPASAGEVKP